MQITKIADMTDQGAAFEARRENEDLVSAALVDRAGPDAEPITLEPTYEIMRSEPGDECEEGYVAYGARYADEDGTSRVWLSWANPGADRKVWWDDDED